MSSLLVGLLLLTATRTVTTSLSVQTRTGERAKADALAEGLLGEILGQSYMEPSQTSSTIGRETGESSSSRANYDDVDDYHGWNETPPQNKDGTTIADLTGWRRQVTVDWVAPATLTQTAGSAAETGMKRITVIVKHNETTITTRVVTKANAP
jgi:hypothetical protein